MALGGGTFTTLNKVLPGTYHNFISAAKAFSNLSERGFVALPISLDWGLDGDIIKLTYEDFIANSLSLLGYEVADEQLKGIRDVFKNAHTIFIYRLNNTAVAASNSICTAKYKGIRGNNLKIVITENVDNDENFDVYTYLDAQLVDVQRNIESASQLVANEFVTFKSNAVLEVTAGTPLTGGSNGTINGASHQLALNAFESIGFNILACLSSDNAIRSLYVSYTKRMRDEVGAKFQLVVYGGSSIDQEGVISIHNAATELDYGLVFWLAGAMAGCSVNKSNTNKLYDGEYVVSLENAKTQTELANLLKEGKLVFHRVNEDLRVLEDVNTFVSFTSEKNEDFSMNQVIRVLDQIAVDTASLFNTRYLGKIPNDANGRMSLWSDVVKHRKALQGLRAIENYSTEKLVVEAGNNKKSVVVSEEVTPTVAMSQLYITTTVA